MSAQGFSFIVPAQSVGANLVYFDLFNGSNDEVLELHSLQPVVSGSAAVTGVLGIDLFLTYTTAIGTGGTVALPNSASLTAASIVCINKNNLAVNPRITLRLTPSGGATAGRVISMRSVFGEETASQTYFVKDFVQHLQQINTEMLILPGEGIRVVQGSVAATGAIGFNGSFHYVD